MSDPVQTRHEVRRALDALEERLEPLIDARLREFLHGLEWTEILRALDESRGRARGRYSRNDLAAQLRILTERLGELGYPFDDDPRHPRRVSSLGTQLRQLRNTERHSDVLEPHDAWRAGDHAAQLLDALGDVEGARRLAAIRDDVGRALYGGGQPMPARRELMPAEDIDGAVTPEVPIPAIPAVLDGAPLGDERLAYEPWHPVIARGAFGHRELETRRLPSTCARRAEDHRRDRRAGVDGTAGAAYCRSLRASHLTCPAAEPDAPDQAAPGRHRQ